MCGPSEHAQPPYFYLQLPCVSVCMNGSNEGDCTKRICVLLEACDLYAPQGVDLGEGGSSHTGMTQSKVIGLGCKCEAVSKAYG